MPRLSPRSPKRKHAQNQSRYRKRLKTRKVFDGCNRDNHDVIMFDKLEIDVIDDQSKTWPGYVKPFLAIIIVTNHINNYTEAISLTDIK